ncbi:hypothetical protein D6745_00350 [Candidatus Woesearchaeota archaeon]|nr:MAG: hypothetical protein D6745_00350 [Candidatus Woesearchaeota archaeon]
MFNLKKYKGTFKGLIGEYMFKLTDDKLIITKSYNRSKFFRTFSRLNSKQRNFLYENWFSIDGIKFENGKIVLYEIKTRNKYNNKLHFKPKTTRRTHEMYQEAKQLGFVVKLVTVWLCKNWDFEVEMQDFSEKYYYVDKEKKYDMGYKKHYAGY